MNTSNSAPDDRLKAAQQANDWPLLLRLSRQALRKNARHHQANRYLGVALHKMQKSEEALKAFSQAEVWWPNDAELLLNHSQTLMELARDHQALPLMERVCALRPGHFLVWLKYAQCCYRIQRHEEGYAAALKAEELAETNEQKSQALMQKAIHRRELGQVKEAVKDCEAAIALDPREITVQTNRLLFMLADPDVQAADIRRAADEYASVVENGIKQHWPIHSFADRSPWQLLKVGFVSPDFRNHSVMYFMEGLLAQLDRRQFNVVALHLHPGSDVVTERAKCHVDQFLELKGLTHREQVDLVAAQRFDVLVDLAGHTGNNGLLLMARKLAPVQVSWLGYPATTGLTAMDYKFTDEVTDPPGADDQYSERLYRLPTLFCCYRPLIRYPLWRYQPLYQVRAAPALQNGFVTFGSCNNLGKLTDPVLALWGRILAAVPGAKLLIEGKNLEKPAFAEAYRQRCARLGIESSRLELVPLDAANQYLTYHRIDIALDPFPLTGGTTTFDVLWMGVPLVSMEGDSFKSRLGTGILSYLGRTEWLAHTADEYVQIATQLAADPQRLSADRLAQRRAVEQSVLMDELRFAHHFGEGLRLMWLQWLAQAQCPADTEAQSRLIESWLPSLPSEWSEPVVPGIGLAPGKRVTLPEAHQQLEKLLNTAKASESARNAGAMANKIENPRWQEVTEFAEKILDAVPNDPVALTCLAEVEHAHGHTDFAVSYLRYAHNAMCDSAM
ncbi:acetylglucosamine transferase [Hydrogenophaga defluvii]|uniref:protein O-GlcNAc transferase n=1 Tax=Hydrogenophaga defluvii TaxID=249410 RepID=A0ABW2SD92_9BURK